MPSPQHGRVGIAPASPARRHIAALSAARQRTASSPPNGKTSPVASRRAAGAKHDAGRASVKRNGEETPASGHAATAFVGSSIAAAMITVGRRHAEMEASGEDSGNTGSACGAFSPIGASYAPWIALLAAQRIGRGYAARRAVGRTFAEAAVDAANGGISAPEEHAPQGTVLVLRHSRAASTDRNFAADRPRPEMADASTSTSPSAGRRTPSRDLSPFREGAGRGSRMVVMQTAASDETTRPAASPIRQLPESPNGRRIGPKRLAQLRRQAEVARSFPDSPYRAAVVGGGQIVKKKPKRTVADGQSSREPSACLSPSQAGGGPRGLRFSVAALRAMRRREDAEDHVRHCLSLEEEGRDYISREQRSAFEAIYYSSERSKLAIQSTAAAIAFEAAARRTRAERMVTPKKQRQAGRRQDQWH